MVEYQWNKNELGQDWETWKLAIVPQVTTYVDTGKISPYLVSVYKCQNER